MRSLICFLCFGLSLAANRNNDNSYQFSYSTGTEGPAQIFREERREADGTVIGKYGYVDPNGHLRVVDYQANPDGFYATGDIGPDKETMKFAEEMQRQDQANRAKALEAWNEAAARRPIIAEWASSRPRTPSRTSSWPAPRQPAPAPARAPVRAPAPAPAPARVPARARAPVAPPPSPVSWNNRLNSGWPAMNSWMGGNSNSDGNNYEAEEGWDEPSSDAAPTPAPAPYQPTWSVYNEPQNQPIEPEMPSLGLNSWPTYSQENSNSAPYTFFKINHENGKTYTYNY